MGLNAIGLGLATLAGKRGRAQALRRRPRLPLLFGRGEAGADDGPAGRRRRGARHRPCPVADGLFRPVRARRRRRGDGHGQPQRQRLDRHQDGLPAAAHLRPRRDDRAQGDRARRRVRDGPGGALRVRARHGRALHQGADRPAQTQAQAEGRGGLRQRHGRRLCAPDAGGDRLRGGAARLRARLHLPALQPQPRRHEDAARHGAAVRAHKADVGLRLRRRRRPLRRGRQRGPRDLRRQGRRDAGARSLGPACPTPCSSPT